MKSAFFLSHDPDLVAKARRAIRDARPGLWEGCVTYYEGDEAIQVGEPGRHDRFTFEDYDYFPEPAWTYQTPPHHPEPGVTMPDLTTVLPYGAVCGSELLFARLVRAVAELSDQPAWILDENDVVWDARAVDPERVLL